MYLHLQAFSPEEFVLFHTILSLRSWAWRIRVPEPELLRSCCKAILLTTSLLITAGEVMIRWHPWTEIPCFGPGEIHDNLFENCPHQDFISFPRCFLDTYEYYLLCCCRFCCKCRKSPWAVKTKAAVKGYPTSEVSHFLPLKLDLPLSIRYESVQIYHKWTLLPRIHQKLLVFLRCPSNNYPWHHLTI